MSQDGAEGEARHPWRYGFSRAQLCMVAVLIMAVPAACMIAIGQFELPDAAFALGVGGACAAFTVWDRRRTNERRRRLIRTTGRIASLAASLPRRTDEETISALGEIRALYDEARRRATALGIGGRRLAGHTRDCLDRIDRAYDAQAGSPRRADASVADVAKDVRELSRGIDSMPLR